MISQATFPDILIVASTMRESDAAEIYATRESDSPYPVAHQAAASPYAFVYRRPSDSALVAAFGALPRWPGVWSIWMFANDLWDRKAATAIIRFVRRLLRTEIKAQGAHRLECKSTVDHHDAHRFIRALGLKPEGPPIRAYGRAGEDFITFSRVEC